MATHSQNAVATKTTAKKGLDFSTSPHGKFVALSSEEFSAKGKTLEENKCAN